MAGPVTGLGLGSQIQAALLRIDTPELRRFQIEPLGFLKGFGNLVTQPFTAGGLRMRYEMDNYTDPQALGANLSRATVVPTPLQQLEMNDWIYTADHFNNFFTSIVLDDSVEAYVKKMGGDQGGIDSAAAMLLLKSTKDLEHFINMQTVLDRRNIMGTVVASAAKSDDATASGTWTGRYTIAVQLGSDVCHAAFRKGMKLSACAPPTSYGGSSDSGTYVGDVYNYTATDAQADSEISDHVPLEVVDFPDPNTVSAALGYATMTLAIYYDATSKSAVGTIMDNIVAAVGVVGTGCVLTPYAGKLAAGSTTKTRGPNFGSCGLLHWMQPFNIETAGGAVATTAVIKNSAGTTISRASGGNFGVMVPKATDHNNATSISMAAIESMFISLGFRAGGQTRDLMVLVNPIVWKALVDGLGTAAQYRVNETPGSALTERYAKYGVSICTYQGLGTRPVVIANDQWWVPPNTVMFVDPSDFSRMAPSEGKWRMHGNGSIWATLRNGDGKQLMGEQAYYLRPWQMHAASMFMQGVIKHTKV
ncbi:MAG: hypothetical protein IMZ62_06730 [Chloroflexi bacterium]|nr:hypothetical protein [Chloroflexota bacterium]